MSIEELVGLRLVVGIPGAGLTPEWAAHLRAIRAGGFIPFARNWETPAQFRALLSTLREAVGRDLLVTVDHEGGRWVRFSSGVTMFPPALQMASNRQPQALYEQGRTEARELRGLGVHMNLAPCVDVLADGSDPIIGPRSYGPDPELVTRLGLARIRGMQEHGLSACAKHFPGLGAVPRDPHHHLPTVDLDWDAMRRIHLAPFVAAIATAVDGIMSSHVCYPRLEGSPGLPATLSARLVATLLRQELGYRGVILTDDLEMGALAELGPLGETAVRAAEAGHDLLLICAGQHPQREVFTAMCAAYRQGRLPRADLDRSVERIASLRRKHQLSAP